ncbi:hypothetical protein GCWU000324_02664 [Kingella oralis ATCC 51147]|uniref:Uncharacterized protein n=1 Tax=Kingella oralis ATCC 51147 TaxID=629741 RepID=C4GLU1_9NEIS|nr:hypothetical protein GCWU000324_02664 [Kingella oralis ATCC 51147]
MPQRGFQLVFVFAEHIGRPLPLQLQRFISDIGAVVAQQPLFQIADEFGLLALVHAVAMQQCTTHAQTDFHAALRIRQIRPRLRLPQPRLRRCQIGRAGKGGVNQAIELGVVECPPPLRENRRLRMGGQAEGGGGFNRGGGVLGMSGAARKQHGTEEKQGKAFEHFENRQKNGNRDDYSKKRSGAVSENVNVSGRLKTE